MSTDPRVVVQPNTRLSRDSKPPAIPVKGDGESYRWRMHFDGNSLVADSDSLKELACLILNGGVPDDAAESLGEVEFATRAYVFMKELQGELRRIILANVSAEEWDDLEEHEKDWLEWDEFVDPSFEDPDFADSEGDVPPYFWSSNIPLVLVRADYVNLAEGEYRCAPLSVRGQYPDESNIIWLETLTPTKFLHSLRAAGTISLANNGEHFRVHPSLR